MLQPRFRIHAPFARANDGGRESNKARMGDDGEGRKTRARPGRNRSPRRELQGNPAEVRTRACRVLRNDLGQCVERIGAARILALRRNQQKLARPSRYPRRNMARGTTSEFHQELPPANSQPQERSRCFDVFLSSAATLREVKA